MYPLAARPRSSWTRLHESRSYDDALERIGDHAFSTTEGVKPISGTTLSGWTVQVVGHEIARFQLKRVRSGVETLLAANRISREIRGHVQSHGPTGIQARHYDGDDYMPEGRESLELPAREWTRPSRHSTTARQQRSSRLAEPRATRLSRWKRDR